MTLRFLALLCAAAVAVAARWRWLPWPEPGASPALDLLALRDPALYWAAWGWQWAYPAAAVAVCGSFAAVAWDVWGRRRPPAGVRGELPGWPLIGNEPEPAIVVGEQHHPVEPREVERPTWLTLPAQGLFTGVALFGATGSGKTSACMRPWCQQLFGWQAANAERRAAGLILEVKGDFCHQVRELLGQCGRGADYLELGIGGRWQWNPLDAPEVDSYSLAYQIASLMNQLFGKGKEPFWQQASTNLLRNLIELHRVQGRGWVTLRDLYRCAIDAGELARKLEAARAELRDDPVPRVSVSGADAVRHAGRLEPHGPWLPEGEGFVSAVSTRALEEALDGLGLEHVRWRREPPAPGSLANGRLEAVERWLRHDWYNLDPKLQTSVVEGVSSFLGVFDAPEVARVFCPEAPPAGRPEGGAPREEGSAGWRPALLQPLPRLRELIESGKVLAFNMPVGTSPALSRATGVMLKSAWLQASLARPAAMAAEPQRYWRPAVFVCDEYQQFATVGEDDPAGDEKSFALTRQSRVIPIVATQSIASLRSATRGGDAWRTLLQCFRTRVFLSLSDDSSAGLASQMCGTVERLKASYNFSESAARAGVSLLSGRAGGARSSVGAGRSYQSRREAMFHPADFAELATCQAIVLPFDGHRALSPRRVYLKPWFLDRDLPYFEAVRLGRLGAA